MLYAHMEKPIVDFEKLDPPTVNTGPAPDITLATTQDQYEQFVAENAHTWVVVEIRPGAWKKLQPNFVRTEHKSYDEAIAEAQKRYDAEIHPKRGSLIYAIADFPGARNMTCCYDEWPRRSGIYGSFYRRQVKGDKIKTNIKYQLPPVGSIEPSERYFEPREVDYSGAKTTSSVVSVGKSQRAIKYKSKRR